MSSFLLKIQEISLNYGISFEFLTFKSREELLNSYFESDYETFDDEKKRPN